MTDRLVIFDTTLRDGEQSPGASMTKEQKVRIAKVLEKMRVDVIESGFPIASEGDFESVRAVAESVSGSTVCDTNFLFFGHGCAGALLAVAQGCIKNH